MPEVHRGAAKSTAWGVLAGVSGSGAFATWIAAETSGAAFPIWPAWVLGGLTMLATCLCFKSVYRAWPPRRRARHTSPAELPLTRSPGGIELVPERDGLYLRLLLRNSAGPAEFSIEVIAIRDPLGRAIGRQHWTVPWLDDSSTEPKRVLFGQTRVLDFASYDPAAAQNEIQDGHGDAAHWRFPAVPRPIEARYYNLRCQADLDEQRFLLTVRLMNAGSGSFTDQDLTIGVNGHEPICEAVGGQRGS